MPIINPEFQKLIPALSEEEYNQLEKNIVADGCRDPIVLWGDTVIDGHNRLSICRKNCIPYKAIGVEFDNDNDVKEWMILNQFGRRNLPNFVRAELALKLKPIIAEKAKERMLNPTQNSSEGGETREILAEKAGVSHDTISKTEKILNEAPEEIKDQLRLGEMSINQAYTSIVKPANYSSESEEWYTPGHYMGTVRSFLDGIDLDPCSCDLANKSVQAKNIFTKDDNSLTKEWFGCVFMNPPYGKDGGKSVAGIFCNKAIDEYKKGNVDEVIILVNSSHTQKWQKPLYDYTVCFVDHRIKFVAGDGSENDNPTFGNIFVYLGKRKKEFSSMFSTHGYVMEKIDA